MGPLAVIRYASQIANEMVLQHGGWAWGLTTPDYKISDNYEMLHRSHNFTFFCMGVKLGLSH
jgi:hypothetical protein